MPVSGDEESGVIVRQSGNCSAGVPIKKRRFPSVLSRSPPPQESSSLDVENDTLLNGHLSQGSALSHANGAVNASGGSDASQISFSEVKKESTADANVVFSSINTSEIKAQDPSTTNHSVSIDNVESKEKLMQTDTATSITNQGSSELDLVPKEAFVVHMKEEMHSKQEAEENCNLKLSTNTENVVLSLACKEPLVPALEHQNSEGCCQVANYLDSSLLSLSLIQGKSIIQGESGDHMVNSDNAHVSANRSNWDLNTTMDAWEGSADDASLQNIVNFDRHDGTRGSNDAKISTTLSGKQVLGMVESRSNFPASRLHLSQHHKPEDSLHLSLSMPLHQPNFSKEHSGPLAKVDSDRVVPSSDYRGVLGSTAKINSVGHGIVKSEPFDENAKHDCVGARSSAMVLSDSRNVKQEVIERSGRDAVKAFNDSPQKSVEHRSMKSEPIQEFHQEVHQTFEVTSNQSVGPVEQSQDNHCSSTFVMPVMPPKSSPSGLLTNLELSASGSVSNQPEHSVDTNELHVNKQTPTEGCRSVDQSTTQTTPTAVGHESEELNIAVGLTNTNNAADFDISNHEACRSQLRGEHPLNLRGNGAGSGSPSDEEKVNISADIVEDSYDSDYESDGNHAVLMAMDKEDRQCVKEDDEYEDGEVREPLMQTAGEDPSGKGMEMENVNVDDCDARNLDSSGFLGEADSSWSHANEKDNRTEDCSETSDDHVKECVDTVYVEKVDQGVEENVSLKEPLSIEVVATKADEKRVVNAAQRNLPHQLGGKEVQQGHEKETSSDGAADGNHGTVTTVNHAADGNVKGTDLVDKTDSVTKAEASSNGKDAVKDVNSSGNRSRIINLPRASNLTSPCRNRPIGSRSFTSRTGRERYTDYEGEKLHLRGNRDEIYSDIPQKFVRERIQGQPFRNPRMIFMRGRGRDSSRLDTLRGEWDADQDFAPEICNGPVDYRFPRHKRTSDVTDSELEYNDYVMAREEHVASAGRGGRKTLNDELPSFRHLSSRRLSPRSRDGPATRGIQMVRRIPRNISPSGSTGEDGSDLVGLRHGEKFMRGLPDDVMDPIFNRSQTYERLDGQFVRGNRNFSSVQRRGVPRIRSKSPVRSGTHSPVPWLSPRRRSPDGFSGLSELTQRRSPVINRVERLRSPDRPCFPEDIVARRRGSPPYVGRQSNDLRDMGTGGDHGHLRSAIHKRRSPTERILSRNTRRFDILDPRERTGTDEFFGRPIRSGRFHELRADDGIDERRNCGEGRGVVRPLRPPYRGTDGQNLRFHLDDGTKPVRFCPDADSEFIERRNLREREFDRPIKSRPIIAHRRVRGIGEQDGNYRHSGQAWHDDALDDDVSRVKRRRF